MAEAGRRERERARDKLRRELATPLPARRCEADGCRARSAVYAGVGPAEGLHLCDSHFQLVLRTFQGERLQEVGRLSVQAATEAVRAAIRRKVTHD